MKNILDNLSDWFSSPIGSLVFECFLQEISCVKQLITGDDFECCILYEDLFDKYL